MGLQIFNISVSSYLLALIRNKSSHTQTRRAVGDCGYQPIDIFRYDSKLKTIYIQGGVNDEIALVIYSDGNWRFF
jgi:hypothetical protein